ncbi:hypothetical protein Glove_13g17 [Diversispora epigaea]|uniref:Uncharacterized protein n=1 Tax=Diversispora epigaea TaxID=1348612 RepID=A0A397JMD1_9GLOM|nr:hypothetical protein Glove_13g17 [Diversispora epigaea]
MVIAKTIVVMTDEILGFSMGQWSRSMDGRESEIGIQIKKSEIFLENHESTTNTTTTTPLNYQIHPQAIYTSRLLNYSSLPKSKNEENFERELEELIMYQ